MRSLAKACALFAGFSLWPVLWTPLAAAAPPPQRVGTNIRVNEPQVGQYGRAGNAVVAS